MVGSSVLLPLSISPILPVSEVNMVVKPFVDLPISLTRSSAGTNSQIERRGVSCTHCDGELGHYVHIILPRSILVLSFVLLDA